jgi:hypothetical protein
MLRNAAERNDLAAWEEMIVLNTKTLLDASGKLFLRRSIEDIRRRLQRLTYLAIQPEHLIAGTHGRRYAGMHTQSRAGGDIMRYPNHNNDGDAADPHILCQCAAMFLTSGRVRPEFYDRCGDDHSDSDF